MIPIKIKIKHLAAIGTVILFYILFTQQEHVHALKKPKKPAEAAHLTLTVRSSQDSAYVSELDFESKVISDALKNASLETGAVGPFYPDIEISLQHTNGSAHYRLEHTGDLWNNSKQERIKLTKQGADKLLKLAAGVRSQHYGKMIPWDEAKHIIPNKSIFSVTDMESGLTFLVQRRAGSDHADVQPMTKKDTAIMKQIYNDHWSWKRKAVLIHAGDEYIAASMNGMPHGGDGIPENAFSGHFCIHFHLSSTHKSDQPDIAHQLMVNKAAGNLTSYFDSAAPLILARTFIEVMDHGDTELLEQLSAGLSQEKLEHFVEELKSIRSVREQKPPKSKDSDDSLQSDPFHESLTAEVRLPIMLEKQNHSPRSSHYLFSFTRASKNSPWRFADVQD